MKRAMMIMAALVALSSSLQAAETTDGATHAGFIVLQLAMIFIYMLPWFTAGFRGKTDGRIGIFFVNLLFGWTVVGWVLCFVWAFTGKTRADIRREDQQHRELLAAVASR